MFLDQESLLCAVHRPEVLSNIQEPAECWTSPSGERLSHCLRYIQVTSQSLLVIKLTLILFSYFSLNLSFMFVFCFFIYTWNSFNMKTSMQKRVSRASYTTTSGMAE